MTKKIIAGVAAVCAAACLTVTAFAAGSVTMVVNNVVAIGSHDHSGNKVTARVSAGAALDDICIKPNVTYGTFDGKVLTKSGTWQNASTTRYFETSISAPILTSSCGGGADYIVEHNGQSTPGATSTSW